MIRSNQPHNKKVCYSKVVVRLETDISDYKKQIQNVGKDPNHGPFYKEKLAKSEKHLENVLKKVSTF